MSKPPRQPQSRATEQPLYHRLHELCAIFCAESGIKCRMQISEEHAQAAAYAADAVYNIVRELLRTVSKRRKATVVTLSSEVRADQSVVIRIEDNGSGVSRIEKRVVSLVGGDTARYSGARGLQQAGGHLRVEDDAGLAATIVLPKQRPAGEG